VTARLEYSARVVDTRASTFRSCRWATIVLCIDTSRVNTDALSLKPMATMVVELYRYSSMTASGVSDHDPSEATWPANCVDEWRISALHIEPLSAVYLVFLFEYMF
jgi:hypothetical protein